MLNAGTLWVVCAFYIVSLWVLLIMLDFYLYQSSQPTISQFLRINPGWFWIPAGIMFCIKIALALHLFVTGGPP